MKTYTLAASPNETLSNWPDFLNVALDHICAIVGESYREDVYLRLFNTNYFFYNSINLNTIAKVQASKDLIRPLKTLLDGEDFDFSINNNSIYPLGMNSLSFGKDKERDNAVLRDFLSVARHEELYNDWAYSHLNKVVSENKEEFFATWLVLNFLQSDVKTPNDLSEKENVLLQDFLNYSTANMNYPFLGFNSKIELANIRNGFESFDQNSQSFDEDIYVDLYNAFTGKNCTKQEAETDTKTREVLTSLANTYCLVMKKLYATKNKYLSTIDKNFKASGFEADCENLSTGKETFFGSDYITYKFYELLKGSPYEMCYFNPYMDGTSTSFCGLSSESTLVNKMHELYHLSSSKVLVKNDEGKKRVEIKIGLYTMDYDFYNTSFSHKAQGYNLNEVFTQFLAKETANNSELNHAYVTLLGKDKKSRQCIYDSYIYFIGDFLENHKDILTKAYMADNLDDLYEAFGKEQYEYLLDKLDKLVQFNDANGRKLDGIVAAYQTPNTSPENIKRRLEYIADNYIGKRKTMEQYLTLISQLKTAVAAIEDEFQYRQEGDKEEDDANKN